MTELEDVFIIKYILDIICQIMVTFFSLADFILVICLG